jgi:hemerythrin
MAIAWTEDLATGSRIIDSQHQELFARINSFLEACQNAGGAEQLAEVLKFLESYIAYHFSCEEKYMLMSDYPLLSEHKAEHAGFVEQFKSLKLRLAADGTSFTALLATSHLMVDWLRNHIMKSDRELAAYLRTQKVLSSSAEQQ